MDSSEASEKIKKVNPEIKIIMITAYEVPSSYGTILSSVLAKPIPIYQLIEAIKNI
jgi:two-component SAPR family response regulator